MKTNIRKFSLSFLLLLLLSNCGVTETSQPESFLLSTRDWRANCEFEVTYTATAEGDAKIDSLVYTFADTGEVVYNPVLPWTKTVTVNRGVVYGFNCGGKISNGKVQLKLFAISLNCPEKDTVIDNVEKIKQ